MKNLDSVELWQAQVKQMGRGVSSCYLLPQEIRRLISQSALRYEAVPGGLFLLEHRLGYQKLMVQLTDLQAMLPTVNSPLVSYVTYRKEPSQDLAKWLCSQGFHKAFTQRQLVADTLSCRCTHEISMASEQEAQDFFLEFFSPIMADLPLFGMFGSLICVRDSLGSPLGMLHFEAGMTRNIAVRSQAERQGIARSLLAHLSESKGDRKLKVWVRDDNDKANRLYAGVGFQFEGLCSDIYIYEPEEL
jgi:GNAT superfamily N-acetyltransferase